MPVALSIPPPIYRGRPIFSEHKPVGIGETDQKSQNYDYESYQKQGADRCLVGSFVNCHFSSHPSVKVQYASLSIRKARLVPELSMTQPAVSSEVRPGWVINEQA